MVFNKPEDYRIRTYRQSIILHNDNLIKTNIIVRETDLLICSDTDVAKVALDSVHRLRANIEAYIQSHPAFYESLVPVSFDEFAPDIIREMMRASGLAGVGPMAAVAGAIAEGVGKDILATASDVIIENGGDIFLRMHKDMVVDIFSGKSPLNGKISIKVGKKEMPMGICTSSGTVGHSLSFGIADACCVKSRSTALADAAATAIGNLVRSKKGVIHALEEGIKIEGVLGILIIIDDQMGAIGDIEVMPK
jgi:ApbE superfamily uncharacterized protein (UPF0280 family)